LLLDEGLVEARKMSGRREATVARMGCSNLVLVIKRVEGTLGSSGKVIRDGIRNIGLGRSWCRLWLGGWFPRQGRRQGTRLMWGIISVMALGRELVTGQQGGDRGPAIAVNFDSHRFVVASLKRNKKFGCNMFDGIAFGRPRIIVWFEMETKVGAKNVPGWQR
jgi:hypothetical protein